MMQKRLVCLLGANLISFGSLDLASAFEFRSTHRSFGSKLFMKPQQDVTKVTSLSKKRDNPLSASSLALEMEEEKVQLRVNSLLSEVLPVLSASLLVTGNTIGAGSLVLPDLVAGPGLAPSIGVFLFAYVMNLLSGLVIAEVAIKQKENSSQDTPSSFKEFAQVNLDSKLAGTAISSISLFVNVCVLAFDLSRAGMVGQEVTGMAPQIVSILWATVLGTTALTQSSENLSKIASFCVTILFLSFGGLLLPGLASVSDPLQTLLQSGVAQDFGASVSQTAPVILMALVYQNIVPSIVKILDYDRTKTVAALSFGSFLPMCLYVAFCYACLGGGIDRSIGVGGELMTVFSIATLTGSSMGSIMSLSEELDTYIKPVKAQDEGFQLPSVALAVGVPLFAAVTIGGGEDLTIALAVAGSFGSPLLYGAIPALMAWNQRQKETTVGNNLVPAASLGALGVLSSGFVGQEIFQRVGEAFAVAS